MISAEPKEEQKPEFFAFSETKTECFLDETDPNVINDLDAGIRHEIDCAVGTAGLTWHQAKAESESVVINSTQDYFSYQESLSVYTFLLDEIRSRNPERLGRVAKRRIETGDGKVWARYKRNYCGRREIGAYRGHYRAMCGKIHDFPGLSETEKLDLYYGLAIKVPKHYRPRLIELYEVEFDEQGVITGSSKMNHWDVVHPDTDRENEEDDDVPRKRRRIKWLRFSERDDGVLWEYLLNYVNEKNEKPPVVTKKFWEEFKEHYESQGATWERVAETYRGRYFKFLAPNLHLMPFDIETKAVLYQTMEILVHKDFRKQLIDATGVILDENGLVTDYENRPEPPFVLQSRHYESVIGISSANRVSILRNPHTCDQDPVPYTEKEEKQIWEFMRMKMMGPKGKPIRIRQKLTGMILWREFQSTVKTKRFTRSLNQHFNEEMIHNILSTDYDFQTKLELLFALDVELEDDELNLIQANTITLHLNTKGAIRYVAGNGFAIGKSYEKPVKVSKKLRKEMSLREALYGPTCMDSSDFDFINQEFKMIDKIKLETSEESDQLFDVSSVKQKRTLTEALAQSPVLRQPGAILMPTEPEINEHELHKLGMVESHSGNSAKFPYLPYTCRPKSSKARSQLHKKEKLEKKRGRHPISNQFSPLCSSPINSSTLADLEAEELNEYNALEEVPVDIFDEEQHDPEENKLFESQFVDASPKSEKMALLELSEIAFQEVEMDIRTFFTKLDTVCDYTIKFQKNSVSNNKASLLNYWKDTIGKILNE